MSPNDVILSPQYVGVLYAASPYIMCPDPVYVRIS